MKKLHVILLLILVLALGILGGIYIGKGSKTNGISKQEAFEKNLKCQEFLSGFIEENTPKLFGSINGAGIFYSPKENSCIGYFHYYDSFESGDVTTRFYDSYVIQGILGNTKRSAYTQDWRPEIGELKCEKESDFYGNKGKYDCDVIDNDKGKELWKKEIEWLKK